MWWALHGGGAYIRGGLIFGGLRYWTSVPVLSIVSVCAVNTKLTSLFALEFSLQVYIELTARS